MSIAAGSRIGPYEVVAVLGAGGPPSLAERACELRRGLAEAHRSDSW
jgi:hypothetical protein